MNGQDALILDIPGSTGDVNCILTANNSCRIDQVELFGEPPENHSAEMTIMEAGFVSEDLDQIVVFEGMSTSGGFCEATCGRIAP